VISVIIPTLNDAQNLPRTLPPLVYGVADGLIKQVIVSDGGSKDETLEIAEAAGCDIVSGPAGRGKQLNAGAKAAKGGWFLFLHAGTELGDGWREEVGRFVSAKHARMHAAAFQLAFDDESKELGRTLFWSRVRAHWLKLPYGDQGLLISRMLFDGLTGYRDLPQSEDVDFIQRIGRKRLTVLKSTAVVSAERYSGEARTKARNLSMMARYLLGANPAELANAYEAGPPAAASR
jgi:rSAM/selenodomain-associated transferase 2